MLTNPSFIDKIYVYKSDVVVSRLSEFEVDMRKKNPDRNITELSFQSRRKLAFVAANTSVVFLTLITLTYPRSYPTDGRLCKKQLHAFLQYLRRVDCEVEYLWFIEFQKRGAPHFHVLLSTPFVRLDVTAVSKRWYAIVKSNDISHLKAGTRCESVRNGGSLSRYAVKYALKTYQKKVPSSYQNVGRFWGHSVGVAPKLEAVYGVRSEKELELYLLRWKEKSPKNKIDYKYLFGASSHLSKALGIDTGNATV